MPVTKSRWEGWRVGERVCREDSEKLGTIIQAASPEGKIKVKWDDGSTSYYEREKPSNVRLIN